MPSDLPHNLRRASKRLRALASAGPPAARRALDRLDRDLLPRTAAGENAEPSLVVGIVGPNNSGKSALFNALAGAAISPSLSEAGATRRLLGAARPEEIELLRAEPSLAARFPIEVAAAGAAVAEQAGRNADDPASLLLVPVPALPPGLVLIDTPDFDSIFGGNRRASEALLAVADLAVVVVTRHTYQNREVVEYLREWLSHGRPWLLVYNEAGPPEEAESIAARHVERLAAAVGTPPRAAFWAPLDLEVQRGKPLETRALGGTAGDLRALLADRAGAAELKAEAMRASLQQLRDDLVVVAETLAAGAAAAEAARAVARRRAREAGLAAARAAWPLGAFADAFRAVLDRRSARVRRGLRAGVRGARLRAEGLVRRITGRKDAGGAA
ncbi:MAG TPA: GTPase, partial [Planctomycetota bacterium]